KLYDSEARRLMGDGDAFRWIALDSQPSPLPPNRGLKFFAPPRSPLSHPEGRPGLSLWARSGWRIFLKVADPVEQVLLVQKVLPGTVPVRERQEGVETDQGVGLVPSALVPHAEPRRYMRDGPVAGFGHVPMKGQTALHADGWNRELSLEQLDGDLHHPPP